MNDKNTDSSKDSSVLLVNESSTVVFTYLNGLCNRHYKKMDPIKITIILLYQNQPVLKNLILKKRMMIFSNSCFFQNWHFPFSNFSILIFHIEYLMDSIASQTPVSTSVVVKSNGKKPTSAIVTAVQFSLLL